MMMFGVEHVGGRPSHIRLLTGTNLIFLIKIIHFPAAGVKTEDRAAQTFSMTASFTIMDVNNPLPAV